MYVVVQKLVILQIHLIETTQYSSATNRCM
nr:MAG TPA: hypothetical protein [Bacteriophage sp.]